MVGLALIEALESADKQATLFLNGLHSGVTDPFWIMMSDKIVWVPLYAIAVFFLFKHLGWKKALVVIASVLLAFLVCDQFSNLVKHTAGRLRPGYNADMVRGGLVLLEGRGGYYGFFSAHAANTFATAMCLIIGFRNSGDHTYNAFYKFALLWAALVSASRIFVGKHFLGDVLVGTAVGITVGYFTGMLARYVIQRYIDKVPPTGLTFVFDKKVSISPSRS